MNKKKEKDKLKNQVTVLITDAELKAIDDIAYKINLTRSQLLRNLIRLGLDDLKVMKYTGILDLVALFRPHERDFPKVKAMVNAT